MKFRNPTPEPQTIEVTATETQHDPNAPLTVDAMDHTTLYEEFGLVFLHDGRLAKGKKIYTREEANALLAEDDGIDWARTKDVVLSNTVDQIVVGAQAAKDKAKDLAVTVKAKRRAARQARIERLALREERKIQRKNEDKDTNVGLVS